MSHDNRDTKLSAEDQPRVDKNPRKKTASAISYGEGTRRYILDKDGNVLKSVPVSDEGLELQADGSFRKITRDYRRQDHLGRYVPTDQFTATTYSGVEAPEDTLIYCADPFGMHPNECRLCALGRDGFITEFGTPLCKRCKIINEIRKENYENSFGLSSDKPV